MADLADEEQTSERSGLLWRAIMTSEDRRRITTTLFPGTDDVRH